MSHLAAAGGAECVDGDFFGGERLVQLVVGTPNHEHLKYQDLFSARSVQNMIVKINFRYII